MQMKEESRNHKYIPAEILEWVFVWVSIEACTEMLPQTGTETICLCVYQGAGTVRP